jgi:3-oxoacyl-[acyl-carrier protein] reductase
MLKRMILQNPQKPYEYHLNIDHQRRLEGKRAIVTGATGGIGSAIVYRFALEGAVVGICGRSSEKIQPVIDQLLRANIDKNKILPLILDVEKAQTIEQSLSLFMETYGGVDILVNNAGGVDYEKSKSFLEQDFTVVENIIDINLKGTLLVTSIIGKKMVCGSRIINIASVVGLRGLVKYAEYGATKAGVINFTQSLAMELGKVGINVNCISPGLVMQNWTGEKNVPTDKTILGRMGRPDEIAAAAAFLVSSEANFITGQNLVVDGGRSLGLVGENINIGK